MQAAELAVLSVMGLSQVEKVSHFNDLMSQRQRVILISELH